MVNRTGRWVLVCGLAALLAGCEGKASESAASEAPAAIGRAGGTVSEPSGATVVVPPGAFEADTVIRVAKDSTGAPALPQALVAAGATYVITPHGGEFAQPVEVRIPAPGVTLQPNQELKLAKAQPGGEWMILSDSVLAEGVLSAQVSSFSFFVGVIVTFPLPIAQFAPFAINKILDCDGIERYCGHILGEATVTWTLTTNGGQLPDGCIDPVLEMRGGPGPDDYNFQRGAQRTFPITGGTWVQKISTPIRYVWEFGGWLRCPNLGYSNAFRQAVAWLGPAVFPMIRVMRVPATLDVVEGLPAILEVLLGGGAVEFNANFQEMRYPLPDDRAIIDWQRSDDGGLSWRLIGRSYQDEANRRPIPDGFDWRYWSVSHGFVGAASDQGALIRAYACYTAPGAATPSCSTGTATRINVLQQSAFPSIVDAPRSVLVTTGLTATFTATIAGTPTPTLQWQTRAANDGGAWSDVATGTGATTGSYATAALSLADNGRQYRVVATNALGSAESVPVAVSVSDVGVAPVITTQPASLSVSTGSDAVFAVAARGTEVLSYQWRLDGAPITGATGPVLRLAAVTAGNAGGYSVVVRNDAGSAVSDAGILTVSPGVAATVPPTIVTQPAPVVVDAGNTATFAVGANGSGPLSFQWRKDGVAIAGATSAALTFASVIPADAGAYSVVVTNSAGSITSGVASLQVNVDPPPVVTPVSITTMPATLVVVPGSAATMAVAASGSAPISYQWSHDGTPIAGATEPVLILAAVGSLDAGSYTVSVTNSARTLISEPAQLILVGTPLITDQPAAVSVVEGSSATFRVTATGESLRYQWRRNGLVIAGATDSVHSTSATALADSGAVFSVLVYNGTGIVFSQLAVLTVTAAPPVTTGPAQAGKLAAGDQNTCAVRADATLACWGRNDLGQVGPAGSAIWSTPYVLPLVGVTAVAVGDTQTCAIHGPGDLSCWGGGTRTPTLVAGHTGVRAVSVGAAHRCFVSSGGGVFCWGANSLGGLGNGTTTPSSVPVQVLGAVGGTLSGVVAVAAGYFSTCALKGGGSVLCWGGSWGLTPTPIAGLSGVTALAQGILRPCALSGDGLVRCWSGTAVPEVVSGLTGVTTLASGWQHTCAVTGDGSVWCWGTGLMGNGNSTETQVTPRRVNGLTGVGVVAAGDTHTCALRTGRTLACWGGNGDGQLGLGDTGSRTTPNEVTGGAVFWGP